MPGAGLQRRLSLLAHGAWTLEMAEIRKQGQTWGEHRAFSIKPENPLPDQTSAMQA